MMFRQNRNGITEMADDAVWVRAANPTLEHAAKLPRSATLSKLIILFLDFIPQSPAPGRGAVRLRREVMRRGTGTIANAGARYGPGSAERHFAPHRVREKRCDRYTVSATMSRPARR